MQAVLLFALCLAAVQSEPADIIRQKFVPVPKVAVHEEAIVHNKPVQVKSQTPHVIRVPKPMVQEVPHYIERTVVITKDIPERQFYPVPQHNFVVRQELVPRPFDAPFRVPEPVIQNVPQEKIVEVPVRIPRVRVVKVPRTQVVEVPTPVEKVEVVNVPEVRRVPQYIRKDIKVPFRVDVPVRKTVKVPRIRTVEVPAPFKVTRKVPQIIKQRVHVPEYFPVVKRISHPFPVRKDVPVFLRRQVAQTVPVPVNIGQIFVSRFFGNRYHLAQARAQGYIPHGARGTVIETGGPFVTGVSSTGHVDGPLIQPAPQSRTIIGSTGESFISNGIAQSTGDISIDPSLSSFSEGPFIDTQGIAAEGFSGPFDQSTLISGQFEQSPLISGQTTSFASSQGNVDNNGGGAGSAGGENGGNGGDVGNGDFGGNGDIGGGDGGNGVDQGGNGDFGGNGEFGGSELGSNGEFRFSGNADNAGNSGNGENANGKQAGTEIGVSEVAGSAGSTSTNTEGFAGTETIGSSVGSHFDGGNYILRTGGSGSSGKYSGSGGYTKDRYHTGSVKYASKDLTKQGVSQW